MQPLATKTAQLIVIFYLKNIFEISGKSDYTVHCKNDCRVHDQDNVHSHELVMLVYIVHEHDHGPYTRVKVQ